MSQEGYRVFLDQRGLEKDQAESLYQKLIDAELAPFWPVIEKVEPENVDKPVFVISSIKDGYDHQVNWLYADAMIVDGETVSLTKDNKIVFAASVKNVHVTRT